MRFIIPLGSLVLIVIAALASGGGDGNNTGDRNDTAEQSEQDETTARLFPGRADAQREDQEREIGQAANIGDYDATVNSAGFQQSISEFEDDGYVVAEVAIRNTGDRARPYNTLDWKLQTPGGQVIDPYLGGDQLGYGDVVSGGSVSGRIIFEVKDQKGTFYVIYKPDPFDAARGIWKVDI